MKTINSSLLPCPFCGSRAKVSNTKKKSNEEGFWAIVCTNEVKGLMCSRIYHYGNLEDAKKIWNTRVDKKLSKDLYGE